MGAVARPWDHRSAGENRRIQDQLLRQTLLQMYLGHVPTARARLNAAGIDPRRMKGMEDFTQIPPTTRVEVLDQVRNPDGPRGLVLEGTSEGVRRFSDRSVLYRVATARLFGGEEVQQLAIEAATRPIHLHLAPGPGGPITVAYTRDDLELFARGGARAAKLVGLERTDRLLNLVPFGPTLDFWGVFYMAHGVGMSAIHARPEGGELTRALSSFESTRPTAIAMPTDEAADFPRRAREAGVDLSEVAVVIAVGRSLTKTEREQLGSDLTMAGAADARVASAYGVAEGRTLWTECAVPAGKTETFGFHVSPDLDIVEILSPETGEPLGEQTPGEIAVTPLGFRGGGVPRWRSGDLALGGVTSQPCPNCGRTVPRVGPSVRRAAWQRRVRLNGRAVRFDFRFAAVSAAPRAAQWQIELVHGDPSGELFVYVRPRSEDPSPLIELYEELERWGTPPTQIVLATDGELEIRLAATDGLFRRFAER
jgi:phenylacetate-coenzyme A ligase PaaK-like adenylate-forming protein